MISLPYYSPASSPYEGRAYEVGPYEGRTRALSTNLDFSPLLSLDSSSSPIYQNVIPFNVAEEIARFEKDYVQPLTERGPVEEEEEGIYEEVKVDEEERKSHSSSSSSLSSDSGAFSRLSTPDLSVKSGEMREKCSSSSGLSTSSSSSSSSSSCQHLPLSPLSSLSLEEDSTHVSAECKSQVTVNGRCYNCR